MLGVLGENLLVLLAFDNDRAPLIRHSVEVGLFGGQYRDIAARIYDYIDRYKKAPNDHLADLVDDKLKSKNPREAELYADIIGSIIDARDGINTEYVMSQLGAFVRRQSLKSITVELVKSLQRDTEAGLEEADKLIRKAQAKSLELFDPGTRLSDKNRALDFFNIEMGSFPTGIAELDRRGFGPTRKELWLYVADTKKGKTWALIHLAKMALMHRYKVLHVTLEMSESRAAQRYFQALFSISKRRETFKITKFEHDNLGRISGFGDAEIRPSMSFDEKAAESKLTKKIDTWSERLLKNIMIKQFPTGQLTVNGLMAYLDNLATTERFVPDLLLLDYPDLMKLDKANYRLSLDEVYKDIRGLAVSRNMAVAAVTQAHRAAHKAKTVDTSNVSEAYSKIAHADTTVTYSQTEAEKQLGLARLKVAAGRNDEDNLTLVISQNYATGQFIVDSTVMRGNYFGLLPTPEGESEE